MTYFECEDCGQLADFVDVERRAVRRPCPVCEARTLWEVAFTDSEQGVSF